MSTFTITPLVGDRALVKGTDKFGVTGQATVDATEHNALKYDAALVEAHNTFDEKVESFFAELTEASAELDAAHRLPELDPATYIVEQEAVEGTQAKGRVIRRLQPDTVVLRLIEAGDSDRLVWVEGKLEVLAAEVTAPVEVPDLEPVISPNGIDL